MLMLLRVEIVCWEQTIPVFQKSPPPHTPRAAVTAKRFSSLTLFAGSGSRFSEKAKPFGAYWRLPRLVELVGFGGFELAGSGRAGVRSGA
jgi:hypothetical protein